MSNSRLTSIRQRIEQGRAALMRRRAVVPPPLPHRKPREFKYLKPAALRGMRNMLFAARTIVEGYYSGRHRSRFKGSAPEFVDYRQYYPGDELRSIDWKAYARTDRHFVRLFEKETDLTATILLDVSASMAFGGDVNRPALPDCGLTKLEYGAYLSAALSYVLIKQGDKAGMVLFDQRIRRYLPPGGTIRHLYAMLGALELCKPGGQTSLAAALRKAHGLFKQRGVLVIVSDFLDEPDDIFSALNMYLHRGFEIVVFHVLHENEVTLPDLHNANFVDSETGAEITCKPRDIAASYTELLENFRGNIEARCRARNITYTFLTTATPYEEALGRFLAFRGRA